MILKSILSAAFISAGAFALSAAPAAAVTLPQTQQSGVTESSANPLLSEVHSKRRYWNRRLHGPRCLRRWGNCRHYYYGHYYSSPWWRLSAPYYGTRVIIRGGKNYRSRHVAWCRSHYRSYKRRSNTWISYSGHVRQCVSPYSR